MGTIALAAACLFMAGLNMWNEFKDWFDKNYQRRDGNKQAGKAQSHEQGKDRDTLCDVIGKSKFNVKEEELKRKQKEAEQAEKITAETEEQNTLVLSMDLEKEKNLPEPAVTINVDEEFIPLPADYTKENTVLSGGQSLTADEFGLLAKTLSGKPVSADEKVQVANSILNVKGTDLYEQITSRVNGAEDIAAGILNGIQDNTNMQNIAGNRFDIYKYVK